MTLFIIRFNSFPLARTLCRILHGILKSSPQVRVYSPKGSRDSFHNALETFLARSHSLSFSPWHFQSKFSSESILRQGSRDPVHDIPPKDERVLINSGATLSRFSQMACLFWGEAHMYVYINIHVCIYDICICTCIRVCMRK